MNFLQLQCVSRFFKDVIYKISLYFERSTINYLKYEQNIIKMYKNKQLTTTDKITIFGKFCTHCRVYIVICTDCDESW